MRRVTLAGVALALGCGGAATKPAPAHPHGPARAHGANPTPGMVHRFDDVARWTAVFDDPARDAWQKPDEIVALLDVTPGMTVVDLGAGTGYLTGRLADAVGSGGRVIATDVEPTLIAHLAERFAGDARIEPRLTTATDAGLAPASVDRIVALDVWHHLADRSAFAQQLARALRPGGKLAIVDFTLDSPRGPHPRYRIAPDALVAELAAVGLAATVVAETLPHEYVVVATAP